MKYAHNIEMRVFSKEVDDESLIMEKINELFPFDFKKEKINLTIQNSTGFEEKLIRIITVSLDKGRHISIFLENIIPKLSEKDKQMLVEQMDTRLDEHLNFYFRFEKYELLNGKYVVTDTGNCFRFKLVVAAYPHKREIAEKLVEDMLNLR